MKSREARDRLDRAATLSRVSGAIAGFVALLGTNACSDDPTTPELGSRGAYIITELPGIRAFAIAAP